MDYVKELLKENENREIIHFTHDNLHETTSSCDDAEDIIYINKESLEKIMDDNPQVNIKNHILENIKNNNPVDCNDELTVKTDELVHLISNYDNNETIENSIFEELENRKHYQKKNSRIYMKI